MEDGIFVDRRDNNDRRHHNTKINSSQSGCRRQADRRGNNGEFCSQPWWLKTNYVEHIASPKLLLFQSKTQGENTKKNCRSLTNSVDKTDKSDSNSHPKSA